MVEWGEGGGGGGGGFEEGMGGRRGAVGWEVGRIWVR